MNPCPMDSWKDMGRLVGDHPGEAYVDVGRKSVFKPDENGEVITHFWVIYNSPWETPKGTVTEAAMTGIVNCKNKTNDRHPTATAYGSDGHVLFVEDDASVRYMDPIQPDTGAEGIYEALCF